MRQWGIALVLAGVILGGVSVSYASDWDVAGKVLTGIEGMRILTGGKVDLIGTMTGINRQDRDRHREYAHGRGRNESRECRKVWVPHYVWEKRWIPEHTEHDPRYGEMVVEGHYVRYKVERGGSWRYDYH